jgi:hypothetical protein
MTVSFRPAKREQIPLLLGVAGGTGSGKTYSALLLARGLANGQPFAIIDTENGRAKHYADLFPEMRHAEIHAPFRPQRYLAAIVAGAKDYPVVVVDSMSHEWAGDGGCLDWHDEIQGGDAKKNLMAWIEPKREHKRMVTQLLQVDAHVILCFRAEPKVEVGKDGKIIPKPSLTGLDGWIPISEKMLPYELTASFLLMADQPGVPKPIKLQEQHKPFVPLDQPLSENTGRQLAAWAAGSSGGPNVQASGHEQPAQATVGAPSGVVSPAASGGEPASPDEISQLTARLVASADKPQEVAYFIEMHAKDHTATEHHGWLMEQERKRFAGARGGDA